MPSGRIVALTACSKRPLPSACEKPVRRVVTKFSNPYDTSPGAVTSTAPLPLRSSPSLIRIIA